MTPAPPLPSPLPLLFFFGLLCWVPTEPVSLFVKRSLLFFYLLFCFLGVTLVPISILFSSSLFHHPPFVTWVVDRLSTCLFPSLSSLGSLPIPAPHYPKSTTQLPKKEPPSLSSSTLHFLPTPPGTSQAQRQISKQQAQRPKKAQLFLSPKPAAASPFPPLISSSAPRFFFSPPSRTHA